MTSSEVFWILFLLFIHFVRYLPLCIYSLIFKLWGINLKRFHSREVKRKNIVWWTKDKTSVKFFITINKSFLIIIIFNTITPLSLSLSNSYLIFFTENQSSLRCVNCSPQAGRQLWSQPSWWPSSPRWSGHSWALWTGESQTPECWSLR